MLRRVRVLPITVVLALTCPVLVAPAGAALPSPPSSVPAVASPAPLPAAAQPIPGSLRTVTPLRLLDTRRSATRPTSGSVLRVPIAGTAGVPKSGVGSVLLHLTSVNVRVNGYVTAYPSGTAVPHTSSLNFAVGRTVSNDALVRVGADGSVSLRLQGAADVDADILGWVAAGAPAPPGGVVPVPQTRLLDTRTAGGTPLTRATRTVQVAGIAGVPVAAAAVVVDIVTVNSTRSTALVVWPAGLPRPATSNLNSQPGRAVAGQIVVGVGTDGDIAVSLTSSGATDLVIDIVGYVVGGDAGPSGIVSSQPVRVLDTRTLGLPMAGGSSRVIDLTADVPADASAAILTLTSVPGLRAGGYLTAFAHGDPRPAISDLNPMTDVPVAIQVVVPLGPDHAAQLTYVAGSGDVVVDLDGYLHRAALPPVNADLLAQSDRSPLTDAQASLARTVLLTANRYALQTWWPGAGQTLLTTPLGDAQSNHQDPVRRLAMQAFALAASVATGAYDPGTVGTDVAGAIQVVTSIVTTVACSHRSNEVGGWGATWQSPFWAAYAGRAAWMLWSDVPAVTQLCVQRMVMSEADFVSTLAPRYMVAANGTVLTAGNTGAEEDSWYALAPALAIAMMPTAEQRDVWRHHEEELLVAAWARPSDVTSSTLVDGVPLSGWLAGSNVSATGVVVNHSRIAPDYSTNAYQSVDTAVLATLAGQPAPQASLTGLAPVYSAMSEINYPLPAYPAPGGPIYQPGSATVYYPQGCDWGTGQELPYALLDTEAGLFGFANSTLPTPAASAAAEHLAAAKAMQDRTPSGAEYFSSTEYNYVGREEHAAQLAAQLYLAYFVAERLGTQVSAQPVPASAIPTEELRAPPPAIDERTLQH